MDLTRAGGSAVLVLTGFGLLAATVPSAIVAGDREITQLEHASGLGLWMVRWIVEAGGGRIGFEDDGTVVVLRLPAA